MNCHPFLLVLASVLVGCSGSSEERSSADASDATSDFDVTSTVDVDPDSASDAETASDTLTVDADADLPDHDIETDGSSDADADTTPVDAADAGSGDDAADVDAMDVVDAADGDTGTRTRGECRSDADCGGDPCLRIHAEGGGFTTCFRRTPPVEECVGHESDPACCSSEDCSESGECFAGPLFYCGGVAPIPTTLCHEPQCGSDTDCDARDGGLCLPAGAFGEPVARCVSTSCRVDADCTAAAGGQCSPFFDACARRFTTFSCTYDDSPCRTDSDCGGVDVCVPLGDDATACVPFMPPP